MVMLWVASVCVCLYALSFESLDLETSFLVCGYICRIFRLHSYIKVKVTSKKWDMQA